MEEVDFTANRGLDKTQLLRLADGSFIKKKESILVTGPTGVGKSYITSALGHQACLQGYKTLYRIGGPIQYPKAVSPTQNLQS